MNSLRKYLMLVLIPLLLYSCSNSKQTVADNNSSPVYELHKDWLTYRVSLIPQAAGAENNRKTTNLTLSIRIINRKSNVSPLRGICTNLEDYNTYYEYLLNRCKDDISLVYDGKIAYPVYYAFENNYNSFPFETINVGYRFSPGRRGPKEMKLVFLDKIFSHDTLAFSLNNIKI